MKKTFLPLSLAIILVILSGCSILGSNQKSLNNNQPSKQPPALSQKAVPSKQLASSTTEGSMTKSSGATQARDIKRLEDVKQIQSALELYRGQADRYPAALSDLVGATPSSHYLSAVPSYPLPVDGVCLSQKQSGYNYVVKTNGGSYRIDFCLGGETNGLSAGLHAAVPKGIN